MVEANNQAHLLDNLQNLLEKQIKMVRSNNLREVEALAEQAESVVEKITAAKTSAPDELNRRREHLIKLYKKLELMLAARKDCFRRQLQQIAEGRKTLKAYRTGAKYHKLGT